jgi:probable HAF family extracellular repeat protein
MTHARRLVRCTTLLFTLTLALSSFGLAQNCTFRSITFPESAQTLPNDVKNDLRVVGSWVDAGNSYHAFLLKDGQYTSIEYPGAADTLGSATNTQGDIVGNAIMSDGTRSGFLLKSGTFTPITVTGQPNFGLGGINDAGDMVGSADGIGFLLHNGTATRIVFPHAATYPSKINNNGTVVGFYIDTRHKVHGFLWENGAFTTIDYVGSRITYASGINNLGTVVGQYEDPALRSQVRGYTWNNGTFGTISYGSQWVDVTGINDNGVIVGNTTPRQVGIPAHGFMAQCQ